MRLAAAVIAAVWSLFAVPGSAQTFPQRLVRIVVNSQAGGTTDATTRLLAEELSRRWNQTVIVDNVVGAGGNLGASQVARAQPDGYTLLVSHPGPLTINELLYRGMSYDPRSLSPITILLTFPNALVVSKSLGVASVQQLIDYGREHPGKLTFGSQGIGTTTHLAGALFAARAGLDMVHVPYRGSPAAILDLTGGRLDTMFDNLGTALPQHEAGATRILAIADDKRSSLLPDVPTVAESGIAGFRSVTWFGLMAPGNTPAEITSKIRADVADIYNTPAFRERLKILNVDPWASTTTEAAQFISDENKVWSKVVEDARIGPQ